VLLVFVQGRVAGLLRPRPFLNKLSIALVSRKFCEWHSLVCLMYLEVYILNHVPLINSVLSCISYYFIGDSFSEQQPPPSPLRYFTLSVYISRSTVIWRWSRLLLRGPPPPRIPYKLLRRPCKPTARLPPLLTAWYSPHSDILEGGSCRMVPLC
jgi:hypothetical protein